MRFETPSAKPCLTSYEYGHEDSAKLVQELFESVRDFVLSNHLAHILECRSLPSRSATRHLEDSFSFYAVKQVCDPASQQAELRNHSIPLHSARQDA